MNQFLDRFIQIHIPLDYYLLLSSFRLGLSVFGRVCVREN